MILVAHVALMVSLAALFTPLFTMGLGVLTPKLYSHGSSVLGTVQQIGGAMGTALAVMILSSRSESLLVGGASPEAATIGGLHWAFGAAAVLCVVVLALVFFLPARIEERPAPVVEPDRDTVEPEDVITIGS